MAIGPKARIRTNVIAFIILGLGLSYAMATQVLTVLHKRMTVYAVFVDGGGVFTNQEVTYRGITVGQVGQLRVVPDGVKIELLINDGEDIPKENLEARVMFKSAVGEQFVELEPASDNAPYLQDGDTIPLDHTDIPVSTQSLLSTLEKVLRGVPPEALQGAVDNLGKGLTGRGEDIARIIESTAELSELFADRAPETVGILRNGTKVGGAFIRSKEDFIRAISTLVPVSESLARNTGNLHRLLIGANLTSDEVLALLRDSRPQIDAFLKDFADVNALQAKHVNDLDALFKFLPAALGNINKSFEPDTGLIRFGLVQDMDNPGCNYGTPRRDPDQRAEQKPPKDAKCVAAGGGSRGPALGDGSNSDSTSSTDGSSDTTTPTIPGLPGLGSLVDDGPKLPPRMADWSWTLLYLNGV
jgi:phospholipid/cholesterol/gamma-HCH transport system substrate-binding protein